LKTPLLLGIITVLLFGSFALSGIIAYAGPLPFETTIVNGGVVTGTGLPPTESVMTCPASHPFIISGTYDLRQGGTTSAAGVLTIEEDIDIIANSYRVSVANTYWQIVEVSPEALCANFNFPMNMGSMIGGELLDIDTMALFVGAIGVNPVITGLVAITMGGVAAQAIWYVNSRRVKKVE